MTIDEVYMLLADPKVLRAGERRTVKMEPLETVSMQKDGKILGRDVDGNPIRATVKGESLARRLAREAKEREERESKKTPFEKRREARQKRRERRQRRKTGNGT